jgi:hypothetical protein
MVTLPRDVRLVGAKWERGSGVGIVREEKSEGNPGQVMVHE